MPKFIVLPLWFCLVTAAIAQETTNCNALQIESGEALPQTAPTKLDVKTVYDRLQSWKAIYPNVALRGVGASDGLPLYRLDFTRPTPATNAISAKPIRVLVTAGVHGSEPGGTTTALNLAAQFLTSPELQSKFDLTIVPLVNPGGMQAGTRDNAKSQDINRSFSDGNWTEASAAIRDNFKSDQFDLVVDLHGAILRQDFFLIGAKDDAGLGDQIVKAVDKDKLLETPSGTYPGYVAAGGDPHRYKLSSPGVSVSNNKGTLKGFFADKGAPFVYTLEYPGRLPPAEQNDLFLKLTVSAMENAYARLRTSAH